MFLLLTHAIGSPSCHWISLTKYKLKDEIIKKNLEGKRRALNQAWGPFYTRATCDCTGHTPMTLADEELAKGLLVETSLTLFRIRKKAAEAWRVGRGTEPMR